MFLVLCILKLVDLFVSYVEPHRSNRGRRDNSRIICVWAPQGLSTLNVERLMRKLIKKLKVLRACGAYLGITLASRPSYC